MNLILPDKLPVKSMIYYLSRMTLTVPINISQQQGLDVLSLDIQARIDLDAKKDWLWVSLRIWEAMREKKLSTTQCLSIYDRPWRCKTEIH